MVLLPALAGRFGDHPDAVRVADEEISWERLAERAARLAGSMLGMDSVAVDAVPTLGTVVTVVVGSGRPLP